MKTVTTRIPEDEAEWLAELEDEMSADRAEATADTQLSPAAATSALYDLVDGGMNLHPKVYTRGRRALEELEE